MKPRHTALAALATLFIASAAMAQAPAAAPGTAAASGDSNQAVATTHTDAPQPAHGANSFTRGQATARLHRHGYQSISGLKKDTDGVWRGTGSKDGASVQVWVDYKGNVGQN